MRIWPVTCSLLLAGCGADPTGATADCAGQVRFDGTVYTSHAFVERAGRRLGPVEVAECHDTGPDAPGSVFTDDAREVTAWRVPGYAATEVVAVRVDRETLAVYVAESVSDDRRDRINAELEADRP